MNFQFNCCGNDNYTDYYGMQFPEDKPNIAHYWENGIYRVGLPESCCSLLNGPICERVRPTGCAESLARALVQNSSVIGVLGVSVMFIQVSCFINSLFYLLLARRETTELNPTFATKHQQMICFYCILLNLIITVTQEPDVCTRLLLT